MPLTMRRAGARKRAGRFRQASDSFIHSFILETYIAPLKETTTQRRSQSSQGQKKDSSEPRIQLKVLTLIYRSHIGQAPRYLRDLIRLPSSAISLCPLRSLDRHDLFVSASDDFYGSDTSLCNRWPFPLEPTPSLYAIHFINW